MTLRVRLVATVAAVALAGLVATASLAAGHVRQAFQRATVERTRSFMGGNARAACETAPLAFAAGVARAPAGTAPFADPALDWSVYDDALVPPQGGPPLDAALRERLERNGGDTAHQWKWSENPTVMESLIRMPWGSGPCAYVRVRRSAPPARWTLWGGMPPLHVGVPVLVVLGLAVLLGMGAPVRRIRRLAGEVGASGKQGFTLPIHVDGSDEITEVARAFAAASGTVREHMAHREQQERVLREFMENTTHDVRTPLAALQGELAAIAESAARGETPAPARVASAIDETQYLAAMFENLAAAARLDSPNMVADQSPVDLTDVVVQVAARYRLVAQQRGVVLEHAVEDPPLIVQADSTLLQQAVGNVVQNAIRCNRRGGHVAMMAHPCSAGRFQLTVLDDGPGVPAQDLPRIVLRGFRGAGPSAHGGPHGLGLGMNIVQRVVALHGWELHLGASEYGGLQVTIEGPAGDGK
ncbi:MAG: HAMP domain-containing histidine kinase [Deltaproteobacteria bacterium]|nr:HAMP domain-containing histidine kinase [Deltaproteobacteria bacterium]